MQSQALPGCMAGQLEGDGDLVASREEACPCGDQHPVSGQFRQCPACGEIGADRGWDRVVGGDRGLDRVTAGQLCPRAGQRLCAEQGGNAGHQSAGGVRLAVTELVEQVPVGAHDIDALRLSMPKHGLGEFRK